MNGNPVAEGIIIAVENVERVLNFKIITLGGSSLTLGRILYIGLLIAVVVVFTKLFNRWIANRVLARTRLDEGARMATARLSGYAFALVGVMVILQTSGIDLTTVNVLAGAVGVALGFGFQTVANNFVCGLIILFEQPIKVGDRVVVGDVHGRVAEIRARSTSVITNDNVTIIIPNSKLIDENVINWSYGDPTIRFRIPVGVAYGSDPLEVRDALLEAASSYEDVLKDSAPDVLFTEFGDSALKFSLRAWTKTCLHTRGYFVSQLNFAIHAKLKEKGISVAFPQRDLHVRSGELAVRVVRDADSKGDS